MQWCNSVGPYGLAPPTRRRQNSASPRTPKESAQIEGKGKQGVVAKSLHNLLPGFQDQNF